ncbi:hypothetical protein ODZ84_04005 [Chryseobacterium fluminis]|uniref:hypothetical protein n=1 Tax=Chryseobacterium fluminis TaxID=2983606 RepID=UPI0022520647|nr:hypothetical protein [Chryseobacterium sp. MMS21-Ot14]UZT98746.1 hypothetical protein ODZ84_04005 [Chryseobacterium sp. MMS21-Ot14]
MQKFLRCFLVFSLLLIFVSHISGLTVSLDHSKHSTSKVFPKKDSQKDNTPTISQDDECQCMLHMHMNTSILPEAMAIDFSLNTLNNSELPQPKAVTYRCLLDFFSSRAPPAIFSVVV